MPEDDVKLNPPAEVAKKISIDQILSELRQSSSAPTQPTNAPVMFNSQPVMAPTSPGKPFTPGPNLLANAQQLRTSILIKPPALRSPEDISLLAIIEDYLKRFGPKQPIQVQPQMRF